MLRIGIDARAAAEVPAGRGRLVRELLRALAERPGEERYLLYARERWAGAELDERFQWRLAAAGEPWWHARCARLANRECDVFLASNSYLTPWFLRIPSVTIVYDMVAFERELQPNRRSAVIERATLPWTVRRSKAFIAISQASADAFAERFPAARARTTVALLGSSPALQEPIPAAELAALPAGGFVLAVGTLEPRKNLPRLVDAYSSLPEPLQAAHPLAVVGALGWQTGPTLAALRSLGPRAQLLGYVSDAALAELYRRCAAFCYPSLGEGFGLPVLEAMAAGAPVVTSNVSSLPEVGGEAVEYVDPLEVASIATGLERVLGDQARAQELRAAGRERARGFSWARFAERTLAVLQEASRAS